MMFRSFVSAVFVSSFALSAAAQSLLMIPNATDRVVATFSSVDGSLVNSTFIDGAGVLQTPINAIDSGRGTAFVSDSENGAVYKFALDGSGFVGTVVDSSNGLLGIHGIAIYDEMLYVPVSFLSSSGTSNSVQRFDLDGGSQTRWAEAEGANDILFRESSDSSASGFQINQALVSNIVENDINQHDLGGEFLAAFHNSDGESGVAIPAQLNVANNGDVLAAGVASPAGIYRYDSAGNQFEYYDVGSSVHGVYELENGNLLWTSGDGVFSLDPHTAESETIIDGGDWQYIEPISVPEPSSWGMLMIAIGFLSTAHRR